VQRKETQRALAVSLAAEKEESVKTLEILQKGKVLREKLFAFFDKYSVKGTSRNKQGKMTKSRSPFNMANLPNNRIFEIPDAFPHGLPEQSLVNTLF